MLAYVLGTMKGDPMAWVLAPRMGEWMAWVLGPMWDEKMGPTLLLIGPFPLVLMLGLKSDLKKFRM